MDAIAQVKEIAKDYFAEAIGKAGDVNGSAYEVIENEDHIVVNLDGAQFKVTGQKRFKVEQTKKAKAAKATKKKGETLPTLIDSECDRCGKKFKVSKFTAYHKVCPDCRTAGRKENGRWMEDGDDRVEKVCDVTGKKFFTSKYTPYVTTSPEGKKQLKAKAAAKEPKKAPAKKPKKAPAKK